MFKKVLPVLLLAFLLAAPACFAADDDANSLLNKGLWTGVVSPEMLGLRIYPDLKDEAVKIETGWPATINVTTVDLRDKHLDDTVLKFSADLKGQSLTGTSYLEMWVHVRGGGSFPVRGYDRPLHGTMPWSEYETSFTLSKGQVVDFVTLNLVVNSKGIVWLKNVKLTHNP